MKDIPDFNVGKLTSVLASQRVLLLAARDEDPISDNGSAMKYRIQACVMSLDTFEVAALDAHFIEDYDHKPNGAYRSVFSALSSVGRALTCSGYELFYIPRRQNQTMPPDEIRVFDPAREDPAYHIASMLDVDTFKEDLFDMCEAMT